MKLSLRELSQLAFIPKIIIRSLDLCLYQALAEVDGREWLVTDNQGRPLKANSLLALQAVFDDLRVERMVVRHESAYDEMINQPVRALSNRLEVPLGRNRLGVKPRTLH
ncbi:DUF6482 family protein [Thalassolituus sp. LLYu03]|uniref:DUF6482 family protein n=1 Tax=Thalassolituus sp. LLYu03 TaxID=3421656 RepID=UPI003D29B71C